MDLRDHGFRSPIAVSIAGKQFLVAFHQYVVHAPSVDREARDLPELLLCLFYAFFYFFHKRADIPSHVSVQLSDAVRETVYLFCPYLRALAPADDMPSRGSPYVYRKTVLHVITAILPLQTLYKKTALKKRAPIMYIVSFPACLDRNLPFGSVELFPVDPEAEGRVGNEIDLLAVYSVVAVTEFRGIVFLRELVIGCALVPDRLYLFA